MKKNPLKTPSGVQDFIPTETKVFSQTLKKITSVFEDRNYARIKTPTLEYYETLSVGLSPKLKDSAIKFFDPSGQAVMLRPDHTTPIARLVASRMNQEKLPLKLSYSDPIFRQNLSGSDNDIELYQAGVELIGGNSAEADAEAIITCIEALKRVGITDFGIDIGHCDFLTGLSDEKRDALLNGDYLAFGSIPERGGKELLKTVPHLLKVYTLLEKADVLPYIAFNKGLIKDLSYYTGIVFEAYVASHRKIVASGGRYDALLAKFGFNEKAVGFAIDVNALRETLR